MGPPAAGQALPARAPRGCAEVLHRERGVFWLLEEINAAAAGI